MQNSAIYKAAQRLEQKPLPQGFDTRVMARLERQQRREALQEQMLFAAGCLVAVALLVWAAVRYIPALDFGFVRNINIELPSLSFESFRLDINFADYSVWYIFAAITIILMLLDTSIRQHIRLKEQTKNEK